MKLKPSIRTWRLQWHNERNGDVLMSELWLFFYLSGPIFKHRIQKLCTGHTINAATQEKKKKQTVYYIEALLWKRKQIRFSPTLREFS